jgi:GT2 family glycosyltransferase
MFKKWFSATSQDPILNAEEADWINGACMVWRAEAFADLNGFDKRYFIYCEDIDICIRLRLSNRLIYDSKIKVIHDARRETLQSPRFFCWHIASIAKLWMSSAFWKYVYIKKLS